jgi:peroxiredoxin
MQKTEAIPEIAPEFEGQDTHGRLIRLADFRDTAVVLAFLRGFA